MFSNAASNLPSPPTSPRLSGFSAEFPDSEWHTDPTKGLDLSIPTADTGLTPSNSEEGSIVPSSPSDRPDFIRPQHPKSYPFSFQEPTPALSDRRSQSNGTAVSLTSLDIKRESPPSDPEILQAGLQGPQPGSPAVKTDAIAADGDAVGDMGNDALDELDLAMGDEDCDDENKQQLTAAEIRAQKRKMKRFRLTHNQTRFLMSEFARQPHPDAAHRERLSREIPGLSPRQVQVWFQNRRAKLKRLTSDDRERMMRSRALPDNFDMTQALHSPFGAPMNSSVGTPLASPAAYSPSFPEGSAVRPLSLDMKRPVEQAGMSPTGISPAFGAFSFTPPQTASDGLPAANTPTADAFGNATSPYGDAPRRGNPFVGSPGSQSMAYQQGMQVPNMSLQEHWQKAKHQALGSPLRSSLSYSGAPDGGMTATSDYQENAITSAAPVMEHVPARSMSVANSMSPFGIGASSFSVPSGFQKQSAGRRPMPKRIDSFQASQYKPPTTRLANTPQTAHFSGYSHQPIATPTSHAAHANNLSAPHNITTFPTSYLYSDVSTDGFGGPVGDAFRDPTGMDPGGADGTGPGPGVSPSGIEEAVRLHQAFCCETDALRGT